MNLSFISQPNQKNFKRKHKSIFSNTNFSNNPDNIIQDHNYKTKGSNENQRIAWEIKFNHSNKKEKDPGNKDIEANLTKSFKF